MCVVMYLWVWVGVPERRYHFSTVGLLLLHAFRKQLFYNYAILFVRNLVSVLTMESRILETLVENRYVIDELNDLCYFWCFWLTIFLGPLGLLVKF